MMPHWLTRRSSAADPLWPAHGRHADQLRWLSFVLFYTVLTNIPYWAASRWLGLMPLGWFCIEYAVVGLLALFLPRVLVLALLLLVIVADMMDGICKTYYLAPAQCLQNLGALHELPGSRLIFVAMVMMLTVIILGVALCFPIEKIKGSSRTYAISCLVVFLLTATFVDCVAIVHETGQAPHPFSFGGRIDSKSLSYFSKVWAGRYPEVRLIRTQMALGGNLGQPASTLNQAPTVASASEAALQLAGFKPASAQQRLPNVVVVLTESWGISKDPVVRDALVGPYLQPALLGEYSVTQGTVPFYGPTIGGEGRELCRSKIGMQIVNVPSVGLKACLPGQLATLGYRSIALHGMDGGMFHRTTWYRSIGFDERWFRRDFQQQGLPDCPGAFTGTCDAAVADWIGRRLGAKPAESGRPSFVYWVTLNSHLPVPDPSGLPHPASCSISVMYSQRPALCSWYQLVANVHESVARIAMSSLARPTVFVIVGDHAPPFANTELRGQFSSSEVPYVVLSPRGEVSAPMQTAKAQHAVQEHKPL